MVVSKGIHCAVCDKKCSGKVLRYQDQYYHKQCFELEQSEGKRQHRSSYSAAAIDDSTSLISSQQQQHQQQHQPIDKDSRSAATLSKSHQILYNNNNINNNGNQSKLIESNYNNNINNNNSNNDPIRQGHSNPLNDNITNNSNNNTSDISGLPTSRYHSQMNGGNTTTTTMQSYAEQKTRGQTLDGRSNHRLINSPEPNYKPQPAARSAATLPHSNSSPANGFVPLQQQQQTSSSSSIGMRQFNTCAGCKQQIKDGQALIALDLHWHVWCFKCAHCKVALHGEYVAKDSKAYCEKDYQKLFGVTCVYCKRYITGKVLQAGEAHHFHPSCARCSKCGDPFVPGEEMYLQGEVTWHPRCGPGPESTAALDHPESTILSGEQSQIRSQLRSSRAQSPSLSSRSHSRSASPFSFMSRQYGRAASPGYTESEALGDLSRVYTISYLNADPTQGYLRRPIEPMAAKSPQFSRPTSATRRDHNHHSNNHPNNQQHAIDRSSRSSSRSNQYHYRDRSIPRGMYSVLSSMRSDRSDRARSPSMMNEEAIQLAQYPSGQKPGPDTVPPMERDDFPAPPFPGIRSSSTSRSNLISTGDATTETTCKQQNTNHSLSNSQKESVHHDQQQQQQQRSSRPRSREIAINNNNDDDHDHDGNSSMDDPQLTKEEEELSKIANGIGKIFLQTLKEREKLRAWKRTNLDPRNASRTPSATRELPSRLRYDNPTNASPSRDMDRPRPWEDDDNNTAAGGGTAISREHSPTNRTRSSLGKPNSNSNSNSNYGYKVIQSNRSTPKPGYGLSAGPYGGATESAPIYNSRSLSSSTNHHHHHHHQNQNQTYNNDHDGFDFIRPSEISFNQQQRIAENRSNDLLNRASAAATQQQQHQSDLISPVKTTTTGSSNNHRPPIGGLGGVSAHLRRSMPNGVDHLHLDGPPKLYPYHLLATSNYRLPPDVDRCHLERHLSNEEFQYIFHCDRLDFYRLPAWKRNELKRRVKLF